MRNVEPDTDGAGASIVASELLLELVTRSLEERVTAAGDVLAKGCPADSARVWHSWTDSESSRRGAGHSATAHGEMALPAAE